MVARRLQRRSGATSPGSDCCFEDRRNGLPKRPSTASVHPAGIGPNIRILCNPAAATSIARLTCCCPFSPLRNPYPIPRRLAGTSYYTAEPVLAPWEKSGGERAAHLATKKLTSF